MTTPLAAQIISGVFLHIRKQLSPALGNITCDNCKGVTVGGGRLENKD